MAMIRWPIPYDEGPNGFEIVGRYIAQVVLMERFIDMFLLIHKAKPRDLKRAKLSRKIEDLRAIIHRPDSELHDWDDLPDMMTKVARNRNLFAHRMFERGAMPTHYGQGMPYERLSDDELREQEREAHVASEVCRQLLERWTIIPSDGLAPARTEVDWDEVLERHARASRLQPEVDWRR